MLKKIKFCLLDFISAVQASKIYSTEHPKYSERLENAFQRIKSILNEKNELVIGIVEEELAWEDEILFEVSQKSKSLIHYLQDKGIERICFHKNLQIEDFEKFIKLLSVSKKDAQEDNENKFTMRGIKNIDAGKMKSFTPEWEVKENTKKKYENTLKTVSQTISSALNTEEIDYMDLRFNILNVMENFMGKHNELINLLSVKNKDMVTFAHLLNVAILSMYITAKMGYPKDDVLDIGTAALFHDVGKLSISKKILIKKSKLTEKEFTKIEDHPVSGSNILVDYIPTLGVLPAVVAFEHHMGIKGKGYPRVDYPQRPHVASLIVSMCDVYDALAQKRSYKNDFPPLQIYNIMQMEKGKLFDAELLDEFFKIMGVWPIGTIVGLSNKKIAVVKNINKKDIFSPRVEILSKTGRGKIFDLSDIQSGIKISRSLNPFNGGKKYLALIN